jgi:hypothetical protein
MVTALAAGPVSAQSGDFSLSADDGAQTRPIARVRDGQWVSTDSCQPVPAGRAPARERLHVTGGQQVVATRAISPGSAEWIKLMPTVLGLFEQREDEQRLLSDRTSGSPRVVDWLYVAESGGARTYYFEASRRVPNASPDVDDDTDPPGTVRIAVAGFLRESSGGLVSLGTKSELRWEQDGLPAGPSRPDLTPLGVLPRGDRSVWVMRGHSGASQWVTLYESAGRSMRTLLTTRGTC